MTLEEKCRLSYYKKIADISTHKNVSLVQHVESMRIFVKKEQEVYDKEIYEYLMHCNNPHIPQIYECIEEEGKLIIIEEYIQGESLADRLEKKKCFTREEVCQLMITICDVLEQLHQLPKPVIHRDLKPENIIIQENGYLKIIDFNTAKQFEPGKGADTVIIGTREYAAPEQYGFKQSDARTDIYAIGVMMNFLLTGEYPGNFVYLEASTHPDILTRIIRKCTAFDPKERYQNVMELRTDLQLALKKKGEKKHISEKRRFLPPGFRTGTAWKMIVAGIGYLFIFWMGFTMEVNDSNGNMTVGLELWANRIAILLWMLLTVAFCTDYLGIQEKFPLMKRRSTKWIGYLLWPFIFLFALIFILVIFFG